MQLSDKAMFLTSVWFPWQQIMKPGVVSMWDENEEKNMKLNEDLINMKNSNKGWDGSTEQTEVLYRRNALFYLLCCPNMYSLGKDNSRSF